MNGFLSNNINFAGYIILLHLQFIINLHSGNFNTCLLIFIKINVLFSKKNQEYHQMTQHYFWPNWVQTVCKVIGRRHWQVFEKVQRTVTCWTWRSTNSAGGMLKTSCSGQFLRPSGINPLCFSFSMDKDMLITKCCVMCAICWPF